MESKHQHKEGNWIHCFYFLSVTFFLGLLAALGYLIYRKKWCHQSRRGSDQNECIIPLSETSTADRFSIK